MTQERISYSRLKLIFNKEAKKLITTELFFSLVKEKLSTKTPFAFARYSDGEIMMLNRAQYYEEYISIINKLWGYKPDEEELVYLSNCLIETMQNVNVIGFPTKRHLARTDYFNDAVQVFERKIGRKYLELGPLLASIDVCYELLYGNKFEELLKDQDTVNYVSCRNLDSELKVRYNIKNINSFIIAPEPKFTSRYVGERHFPNQFNKIKDWISTLNCTGQLCLVGGGVPSKIYNLWFKEQGGVSLDIGAVFDLWSGYRTRGAGRGVDVIDNQYKL